MMNANVSRCGEAGEKEIGCEEYNKKRSNTRIEHRENKDYPKSIGNGKNMT